MKLIVAAILTMIIFGALYPQPRKNPTGKICCDNGVIYYARR
jgi:hypothetical protein